MRLEVSDREVCYECNRHVAMTVNIGDLGDHESGAQLCIDCLRAAVALIEATQPQQPRPGDFVAGFIFTAEGDTIFRIGTWPGKNAPAPQEETTT